MTNEELKKKIVEILEETECEWTEEKNGYILQIFYDKLAAALIAAEIGDVWERTEKAEKAIVSLIKQNKEAEHRAARAERALKNFAENITCEDCPFFQECTLSSKLKAVSYSQKCFGGYLRQSEKELASHPAWGAWIEM